MVESSPPPSLRRVALAAKAPGARGGRRTRRHRTREQQALGHPWGVLELRQDP
jgi:hypothetical protein